MVTVRFTDWTCEPVIAWKLDLEAPGCSPFPIVPSGSVVWDVLVNPDGSAYVPVLMESFPSRQAAVDELKTARQVAEDEGRENRFPVPDLRLLLNHITPNR